MNRASAISYITLEYHTLSQEAGDTSEVEMETASNVIDKALRSLGYSETALPSAHIEDDDVAAFLALVDFHTLARYAREFSTRIDVTVPGALSASRSQLFRNVTQLLTDARARLSAFGLSPDGTGEAFSLGRITLDMFEPGDWLTEGGLG